MLCCIPVPMELDMTRRASLIGDHPSAQQVHIFTQDHTNYVWWNRLFLISALVLLAIGISSMITAPDASTFQGGMICVIAGGLFFVVAMIRSYELDKAKRIFDQKIGINDRTAWQLIENVCRRVC